MRFGFEFLLTVAILIASSISHGYSYDVRQRDVKLPSQVVMEKQTVTAPEAADDDQVLTSNAGPTSAAALTISTGLTAPDVPRNLSLLPGGTTDDVAGCTVVVSGTDFYGAAITENFVVAASAATATAGAKAFKSVSSIYFPANCEAGGFAASWKLGVGEKLGLKRCLASAGHVVFATLNGVYEGTRPTVAANATAISGNTIDLNSSLDGNDVEAFFVQNYRCAP